MHKILVTGVGGGVGQSIIKILQDTEYIVIGADGETLGTGLYAVHRAYKVPYASDPDYIPRILDICRTEDCDLIFPGLDAELPILASEAPRIHASGTIPVVSAPGVVEIADDKLATCTFLSENGFPAPLTLPLTESVLAETGFPFVLKPRKGERDPRGVHVVKDGRELSYWLAKLPLDNYVAQEYLEGDEYTCGSLNFGGHCYGTIVMRRILRDGDTYKAFVVNDEALHAHVKAVAEALRPFGPCNFQLRLSGGVPQIFEINARCSGTTFSKALAGFNEPLMASDFLLNGRTPVYQIREIAVLRYWKELVVGCSQIEHLSSKGWLLGDGSKL